MARLQLWRWGVGAVILAGASTVVFFGWVLYLLLWPEVAPFFVGFAPAEVNYTCVVVFPRRPDHLLLLVPVPVLDGVDFGAALAESTGLDLVRNDKGVFLRITERDLDYYNQLVVSAVLDTHFRPTTQLWSGGGVGDRFTLSSRVPGDSVTQPTTSAHWIYVDGPVDEGGVEVRALLQIRTHDTLKMCWLRLLVPPNGWRQVEGKVSP